MIVKHHETYLSKEDIFNTKSSVDSLSWLECLETVHVAVSQEFFEVLLVLVARADEWDLFETGEASFFKCLFVCSSREVVVFELTLVTYLVILQQCINYVPVLQPCLSSGDLWSEMHAILEQVREMPFGNIKVHINAYHSASWFE